MKTVLVKVGGSLLTMPDLSERLQALIDSISADRVMLLVGGGRAADLVREWDDIHQPGDEISHWLAIDSLSLTARLVATLLPDADQVESLESAHDGSRSKTVILNPRPVIEELSRSSAAALPTGWDCTSDSIAAWIASHWKADSLLLAKSVAMPRQTEALIRNDSPVVDPCFDSVVAASLPVYWCDFRNHPDRVELWKPACPQE